MIVLYHSDTPADTVLELKRFFNYIYPTIMSVHYFISSVVLFSKGNAKSTITS